MKRNPRLQQKWCTFNLVTLTKFAKPPYCLIDHIHSIFNNTVQITLFIHYFSKLNFLCICVSTTINNPQNLGIQLHKRCNKDLPKLQMTKNENKNKNPPVHHSTIPPFQQSSPLFIHSHQWQTPYPQICFQHAIIKSPACSSPSN